MYSSVYISSIFSITLDLSALLYILLSGTIVEPPDDVGLPPPRTLS
jgi:hypothetical protein